MRDVRPLDGDAVSFLPVLACSLLPTVRSSSALPSPPDPAPPLARVRVGCDDKANKQK